MIGRNKHICSITAVQWHTRKQRGHFYDNQAPITVVTAVTSSLKSQLQITDTTPPPPLIPGHYIVYVLTDILTNDCYHDMSSLFQFLMTLTIAVRDASRF